MFLRLRKTGPRLDASCQSPGLGASPQTPGFIALIPIPRQGEQAKWGAS